MTPEFVPGHAISHVFQEPSKLLVSASSTSLQTVICPQCNTQTERVHGHYHRHPKDLPWSDCEVQLDLRVTRYRCENPTCPINTFSVCDETLLAPRAQRTNRLQDVQARIGLYVSANGGVDLLEKLSMPCSRNSILRSMQRIKLPAHPTPGVLGVDDWAIRKGKRYGTILVDLEQHRVVDLLEGRDTATLQTWLETHPGVRVIARDRASDYSRAIDHAVPHAVQVADRFHLVKNLSDTVQAWLERCKGKLFKTLAEWQPQPVLPPPAFAPRYGSSATRPRHTQAHRQQHFEQYQRVLQLHVQGYKPTQIARQVGIPYSTVREWLQRGGFPMRLGRKTCLNAEHEQFIRAQFEHGSTVTAQVYRGLLERGFCGSKASVHAFVRFLELGERLEATRYEPAGMTAVQAPKPLKISVSQITRWFTMPLELVQDGPRQLLEGLSERIPEFKALHGLALDFKTMIGVLDIDNRSKLGAWITAAQSSGVDEIQRFATGLQRDFRAVAAGLTMSISNAQTEGQVTKLKLIKRQRYGRAGFELLRRCVLLS